MVGFDKILDEVLEQNLVLRQVYQEQEKVCSRFSWLKDFGTVSISYGRATGKTTALKRRASSSDLVIVHNWYSARDFEHDADFKPKVDPVAALGLHDYRYRGFRFDRIWVDDASYVLNLDDGYLDRLYKTAVMTRAKQVILIG